MIHPPRVFCDLTMMRSWRFWSLTILLTALIELLTVGARLAIGQSAEQFNHSANPPLILKVHHPVYAVPLLLLALVVLWKGDTGRHWP
jgi:hypothetical protein